MDERTRLDAWRMGLGAAAGERRIDSGWRQAKAGIRLLRRDRSFAALALLLAVSTTALWIGFFYFERSHGTLTRDADHAFRGLIYQLLVLAASSFLSLALACAADAGLDGAPIRIRDAFADAWERIWALLGWLLFSVVFWVAATIPLHHLAHGTALPTLAFIIWFLATLFVLPAIASIDAGPLAALAESLRLLRRSWAQALSGLLGIGFLAFLLTIAAGLILRAGNRAYPTDHGNGTFLYFAGIALLFLSFAAATAAREAFAVILLRDRLGDLPGTPPAAPQRQPWRWRRVALGVGVLVVLLFVAGAIFGHRRNSDGGSNSGSVAPVVSFPVAGRTEALNRGTFLATVADERAILIPRGSPVSFEGKRIGEVLSTRLIQPSQPNPLVQVLYRAPPSYAAMLQLHHTEVLETGGEAHLVVIGP